MVTVILGIIVATIDLILPKSVQFFLDYLLPERDFELLIVMFAALIILVAISIGVSLRKNAMERKIQELVARDVQLSVYRKIKSMGISYFEEHPVGESVGLLQTEVDSQQRFYRELFPNFIRTATFSAISIVMMCTISVRLTVVMLLVVMLYSLFGKKLDQKVAMLGEIWGRRRISLYQTIYETLSAQLELRANSAVEWGIDRGEAAVRLHNKALQDSFNFMNLRKSVRFLFQYAGVIATILYALYLLEENKLSVGEISAYFLYLYISIQNITALIVLTSEQQVVMRQVQRLYDLQLAKPDIQEPEHPVLLDRIRGDISIDNIDFGYKGKPSILHGFSLNIKAGQRIALVGFSGEGKSTLLKLIPRFYDPRAGGIRIDNVDIRSLSLRQLRREIGIVFQETYLFGSTVKDNILIGKPNAGDEEVIAAAKAARAHEFIMKLPLGYDTPVKERGVVLSGGQKQRISIARLFLKSPSIILLDEATAALDNISEKEVADAFKLLMKGRTTLTVAHRISTVIDYDQIAYVQDGQIAECGSYEELMAAQGRFFNLIRGQSEEAEA